MRSGREPKGFGNLSTKRTEISFIKVETGVAIRVVDAHLSSVHHTHSCTHARAHTHTHTQSKAKRGHLKN